MAYKYKKHYEQEDRWDKLRFTICGLFTANEHDEYFAVFPEFVTCGNCIRLLKKYGELDTESEE